jgi:hypothetical protein
VRDEDSRARRGRADCEGITPVASEVEQLISLGRLGLVYAGVTSALIVVFSVSGWCWQTENMTGLTHMRLRNVCLGIWAVSGVMLAVSQIAFLAIGVRMKHKVVLAATGGILLLIAGFVFLLSMMPS